MSNKKKNNHELTVISRYLGLMTSKYIVFALLIITYYPMNIIPGYILLAGIVFPVALKFATDNDDNRKNDDDITKLTLYPTAKKYRFSSTKYRCESYNFILMIILLFVWQLTLNKNNVFSYPKNIIPSFILIIYILSRFLGNIIFKIKLHYDFMNMNI
ncbi:hypothetical protein KQI69_03265 [Eubacterium sp. MSJ-13]|uniref:hypothetical protein n=1 Tax=Eubacterium sp. MSJ-13 TaxID=2841513 RepID=UPI001C126416|nr:hypothetical protein [Eubacterium sp. MSJ-13]MBU5478217.1 hypothetical protein [Eubacterium sp. MSJ-13]